MNEDYKDIQKVFDEIRQMNNKIDRSFIVFAISNLAVVCRKHSCSDCPLEPKTEAKCPYVLLKEQFDYHQAKTWKDLQ